MSLVKTCNQATKITPQASIGSLAQNPLEPSGRSSQVWDPYQPLIFLYMGRYLSSFSTDLRGGSSTPLFSGQTYRTFSSRWHHCEISLYVNLSNEHNNLWYQISDSTGTAPCQVNVFLDRKVISAGENTKHWIVMAAGLGKYQKMGKLT